jgi:dTDP-4-amino-4,6-dideoxygalactose transaminase
MNIPLIDLKLPYKKVERKLLPKLRKILSEQRLTTGAYCAALEEGVARLSGVENAVSCANGTDALVLALMALGIKRGDEVITTPYTFFSTASSVALVGATPVFVDVKKADLNIDPELLERAITPRTKAITVVHLYGRLCDMEAICGIAKKHGIAVIEDMAQSLGAHRGSRGSGSFGDIAAVSFYPTKNLGGIGEGGMVLSRKKELAERTRKLRSHGMDAPYHHEMIGINARLDEVRACALVEKLPFLEEWNRKRIANGMYYNQRLADLPLVLPPTDGSGDHIFHQYVIRTKERDTLQAFLKEKGIGSGIYYPIPLHLQPCFSYLGYKEGDFEVAEDAARTSLALPIFPELKKVEKDYILDSLRAFFKGKISG